MAGNIEREGQEGRNLAQHTHELVKRMIVTDW